MINYDAWNPHARSLNAHKDWRSDWDAKTHLRYLVRKCYAEHLSIPSFQEHDENPGYPGIVKRNSKPNIEAIKIQFPQGIQGKI